MNARTIARTLAAPLLLLSMILGSNAASAQAPAQPQQPAAARGGAAATAGADPDLTSSDPEVLARSVRVLGQRGDRNAVRALLARIREGLPPRLLDAAVQAIAAVRRSDAARALTELATHRRSTVRVAVADGLGAMNAPGARTVLVRMLDDASPQVRSAAATALGATNAQAAMRDLIVAAKRGLPEAVTIVGARAGTAEVRRIARELDATSVEVLAPALQAMATRDDIPVAARLAVVEKLTELRTPAARAVLRDIAASLPEDDRVAEAARAAEVEEEEAEGGAPETNGATAPPAQPAPAAGG